MATLFFTGSIFGSGEMSIAGEGTQIDIEAAEFLQFENTSIGSSSTATISVSNAGSGSMTDQRIRVQRQPIFSR